MITQEYLHSILDYNQETGIFTWKAPRQRINVGDEAGCDDHKGYLQIQINEKAYRTHRLAWFYVYGEWPDIIDHINGNPKDNRIANLRNVNHKQNRLNSRMPSTNKSGVKGVSWDKRKKKWRATLVIDDKHKHLGYFDTVEEAALIVKDKRIETHGEFANHGEHLKGENRDNRT